MGFDDEFEKGFEDAFEGEGKERKPRFGRSRFANPDDFEEEPQERNYNEGLDPYRNNRLVIFGGSFDPIHNGHLKLAEKVLELGKGDEVMFIPAKQQPLKSEAPGATPEQRLEMLKLAVEGNDKFMYSDIELQREGTNSYTIDTMEVLRKVYPDCKLLFLMGTDSLRHLHQWKNAFELVNHYDFIIYPRPGVNPPAYAELAEHFGNKNAQRLQQSIISDEDLPVWETSSTQLRAMIASGQDVSGLLPAAVIDYIRENKIYA